MYTGAEPMRNALATLLGLPASLLILAVRLYQRTLSPDHGLLRHWYPHGFCRHEPTCSQYAVEVLQKRSLPVALMLIVKRVVSCNPWKETSDKKLLEVIQRS